MALLASLHHLTYAYPEKKSFPVLAKIDFEIETGNFTAVVGPNGSGKTTLVKIILGLLTPDSGSCTLYCSQEEIGYVPQRYYISKNFPGTVREILSARTGRVLPEEYQDPDIPSLLGKRFIDLSGGQQQRVLIALAISSKKPPRLLILDEPTSSIDPAARQYFYRLLQKLNREGIAILLVTHELGLLPSLVNQVLYLDRGHYHTGTLEEMRDILPQLCGVDIRFQNENKISNGTS